MFTTSIIAGAFDRNTPYANVQHPDKETAIAMTIARANELFTEEYIANKGPMRISIVYPSGQHRTRWINKENLPSWHPLSTQK